MRLQSSKGAYEMSDEDEDESLKAICEEAIQLYRAGWDGTEALWNKFQKDDPDEPTIVEIPK